MVGMWIEESNPVLLGQSYSVLVGREKEIGRLDA